MVGWYDQWYIRVAMLIPLSDFLCLVCCVQSKIEFAPNNILCLTSVLDSLNISIVVQITNSQCFSNNNNIT
jgi:hypothetical protein